MCSSKVQQVEDEAEEETQTWWHSDRDRDRERGRGLVGLLETHRTSGLGFRVHKLRAIGPRAQELGI